MTYIKISYPIVQRLFAMRRYGGGILYATLSLAYAKRLSGFELMTNKSPRHNFTAALGLTLEF